MEKLIKNNIEDIESLKELVDNWETWGREYKAYIDSKNSKERSGKDFYIPRDLYITLRENLKALTRGHCTFCDSYPFDQSKKTIEHFRPKTQFPEVAYDYKNLFYCCDKCQSHSNKKYEQNIKPDHKGYCFIDFFEIDLEEFIINPARKLKSTNSVLYNYALKFIDRYGINQEERITRRRNVYRDLKNYFTIEYGQPSQRKRDDFPFRYIYDELLLIHQARLDQAKYKRGS